MSRHFPICRKSRKRGTTFLENARLKAEGISRRVAGWVLSDDSGLEVDSLDGAPGVGSSSYGGEEGNHVKNNARLLGGNGWENGPGRPFPLHHGARPRRRGGGEFQRNGRKAALVESLHGSGGFGYDPLFVPAGYDQTFAELGDAVKIINPQPPLAGLGPGDGVSR